MLSRLPNPRYSVSSSARSEERRYSKGCERMVSPTLQTHQEPQYRDVRVSLSQDAPSCNEASSCTSSTGSSASKLPAGSSYSATSGCTSAAISTVFLSNDSSSVDSSSAAESTTNQLARHRLDRQGDGRRHECEPGLQHIHIKRTPWV